MPIYSCPKCFSTIASISESIRAQYEMVRTNYSGAAISGLTWGLAIAFLWALLSAVMALGTNLIFGLSSAGMGWIIGWRDKKIARRINSKVRVLAMLITFVVSLTANFLLLIDIGAIGTAKLLASEADTPLTLGFIVGFFALLNNLPSFFSELLTEPEPMLEFLEIVLETTVVAAITTLSMVRSPKLGSSIEKAQAHPVIDGKTKESSAGTTVSGAAPDETAKPEGQSQTKVSRENVPGLIKKGLTLIEKGDLSDAQSILLLALATLPNDPGVHRALAILRERQGSLDQAVEEWEKVEELTHIAAIRDEALGNVSRLRGKGFKNASHETSAEATIVQRSLLSPRAEAHILMVGGAAIFGFFGYLAILNWGGNLAGALVSIVFGIGVGGFFALSGIQDWIARKRK